MLRQWTDIKEQHPDKLLLFRMGDFFETFFDDAKEASRILGITLTARDKRNDNPIPLAGFPHHSLQNYLEKLVKAGIKVVICEQMEDPKLAKGIVKRDIVEIITPGAILDEQLIDSSENNFLSALVSSKDNKKFGLAHIDVSTGDFFVTEIASEQIRSELTAHHPAEILVMNCELEYRLRSLELDFEPTMTIFEDVFFDKTEAPEILKRFLGAHSLEGFGIATKKQAILAGALIIIYLQSLKKTELKHITKIQYYDLEDFMTVDEVSARNLELVRSIRFNTREGTLIAVMDNTCTPMGARLLSHRLVHPLMNEDKINKRLDAVEELKNHFHLTGDIRTILSGIGDLSRIISKIGTMRVNPRELLALADYLGTSPAISDLLSEFGNETIRNLNSQTENYNELVSLIHNAITDSPPIQITEGYIIRDGYHDELDELRSISRDGKSWIARLETQEKEKTGIPSLKVGYNKIFGYYIEITKTHKDKVPEYYIRKQTLVNSERYISPELKEYEAKVLGAEERIKNLEYELFVDIREKLFQKVEWMQQYVLIIAELDFLCNLAWIAYHHSYCRPCFNREGILDIRDSRHPVIEILLKEEEFIPNDIEMNHLDSEIALVTGPNMAGKSTYLRQIGLLAIMAQIGSFIPAKKADMPVFDKVFTRVGASDNLARGQSTFLVEMLETANILNSATSQSLILLDEIGRGTSTFDGLSLAWSIVEFIDSRIKAITLFATHYHELTELENVLDSVKNYNVAVKEYKDKMIFLRKIKRGGSDQSYGIQVAKLAGVPQKVIGRAKQILHNLEEHELSPQGLTAQLRRQLVKKSVQRDFMEIICEKAEAREDILEELRGIEIENMTPLEALQILQELKHKLEK
ncbi:MAG: DNA mismatch repair protein MutS [Candidatus Cloacimonetes bacterium]|nr:DNA mismatch repair protein MutS [Candidatus Cloacimonadota bacterium]